jgi:hypothetical protein
MPKSNTLVGLALLLSCDAQATTYLCVEKQSVGFIAERKYATTEFTAEQKFIVRSTKKNEQDIYKKPIIYPFVWYTVGLEVLSNAKNGCDLNGTKTAIVCNGTIGDVITIDIGSGRFEYYTGGGYAFQDVRIGENYGTMKGDVAVGIGICEKIL